MSSIKLIIFDLWKTLAYRDVKRAAHLQMLDVTGIKMSEKKMRKIFEK